jgi:hypothetical protein
MTVTINGEKYVPQAHKISDEAVRLVTELNRDIRVRLGRESAEHAKIQRLQYLLTDIGGRAR